jgi:hypothetical protein
MIRSTKKTVLAGAAVLLTALFSGLPAAQGQAAPGQAPHTAPSVPAYATKGPIEARFAATGPLAVRRTVSSTACDRKGDLCDVWYPSALGTNPLTGRQDGFRHPIIAWANGTGQTAEIYAYYLAHLASWGFVVVSARDKDAGDGATTADAATWLIKQNSVRSSIFYHRLDPAQAGAAGHSQGGAAVTSLHAHGNPLFRTYIAFHTSPPWFAALFSHVTPATYAGTAVRASMFQWSSVPDSGQPDWYDAVPNTAQKAYARLRYTLHADIIGRPKCWDDRCVQGAYGYLGYSTAWFVWQLMHDASAGAAFRSGGEFLRPDPNWSLTLSNIR